MQLFAFDVVFKAGVMRPQTMFFHDFRIETALIRAADKAREMYGAAADHIVSITPSTRFNA